MSSTILHKAHLHPVKDGSIGNTLVEGKKDMDWVNAVRRALSPNQCVMAMTLLSAR